MHTCIQATLKLKFNLSILTDNY